MKNKSLTFLVLLIAQCFISCEKEANEIRLDDNGHTCQYCQDGHSRIGDKVFESDNKLWLWGGNNDDWHFNISNLSLPLSGFKYGLGRETFKALMVPQYQSPAAFGNSFFKEQDEFIVVEGVEEKKAYPIDLMIQHEVINDVIEGEPIMVGYCVLADFAGVFSRKYCGQVFTFAVSGYTYFENGIWDGKDGFVLWDRDTESLWWPLIGQAVSGGMKGEKLNSDIGGLHWEVVTWEELKSQGNIKVLKYSQTMEPPIDYPRIDENQLCN